MTIDGGDGRLSGLPMLREIQRYYAAYCAENGVPATWTQRSEIFQAQIKTAIAALEMFTQEDINLLTRLCVAARELSRDDFLAADNLAARIAALLSPRVVDVKKIQGTEP